MNTKNNSTTFEKLSSLLGVETLSTSQLILASEITVSERKISSIQRVINEIDGELNIQISDKINHTLSTMSSLHETRNTIISFSALQERRKSLIVSRDIIARSIPKKKGKIDINGFSSIVFELTKEIKLILSESKYPNLTAVSFNEEKMDFLISGEDRELTGKGYRAITYSAFITGIQRTLQGKEFSIGVPILDSPLVTYRKPEAGTEGISVDLAMDFYRYLSKDELNQIIVLENEEPPVEIESKINHIVFTQSVESGRYGFIPPFISGSSTSISQN